MKYLQNYTESEPASSRARMKFPVNLMKQRSVYMCVNFGCVDGAVSQHLLNSPQICTSFQ